MDLLPIDRSKTKNIDGDENGDWIPTDPSARQHRDNTAYYTVWSWRNGRLQPTFCDTEKEAVETALSL